MPEITVESDYDGYFERMVDSWIEAKVQSGQAFKHSSISISAGPYRTSAVSYVVNKETNNIHFDFYSALRAGFGSLSPQDIEAIVELL